MKAPITVGIAIGLLSEIIGFRVGAIQGARVSEDGGSVFLMLLVDIDEKELENEQIN